jgi:decaprenyl-phosphate phosphoribosyltransferase
VGSALQSAAASPAGTAAALLEAMRPRQWVKNLLVLAAPVAAGVVWRPSTVWQVAGAVVALCLASSGTYLLNDSRDAALDRLHPRKRLRPIASGRLPVGLAVAGGLGLIAAGLALATAVRPALGAVVLAYVAVAGAYTLWLRSIEVLDVAAVASLFIIRAVAGGVAVDVRLSQWFLIVASFSALFVVAGKRSAELASDHGLATRPTLAGYTAGYLRYVWMMASTVAVGAYCVWAFGRTVPYEFPWMEVSIIPFVLGVLRYALLIDANRGGTPEELMLEDAPLRLIGLAWLLVFVAGAYSTATS